MRALWPMRASIALSCTAPASCHLPVIDFYLKGRQGCVISGILEHWAVQGGSNGQHRVAGPGRVRNHEGEPQTFSGAHILSSSQMAKLLSRKYETWALGQIS